MKTITEYAGRVEIFLELKAASDLDDAITKAGVPENLQKAVRDYISGTVIINEPSLLRSDLIDPGNLIKLRPSNEWLYTEGYKRFLIDVRQWNKSSVENIIYSTSKILERFPKVET